ncbi:hypothetical protein ACFLRI_02235 [Bacteroidota bacterium]
MENHKRHLSHIRDLLALAICDGSLDKEEQELIQHIAKEEGISKEELDEIYQNPGSIQYIPPVSDKDKIEQLYNMVHLIMANHKVSLNEMILCKVFASKIGFKPPAASMLISAIKQMITTGKKLDRELPGLLKII